MISRLPLDHGYKGTLVLPMRLKRIQLFASITLLLSFPLASQVLGEPVLEYELAPGEMAHLGTAKVSVFADGSIHIVRPPYWRDPGSFISSIGREQVADLLKAVRSVKREELSNDALAERHAEQKERTAFFEVHDSDRVTVLMRQFDSEERITVSAPAAQSQSLPNQESLSIFVNIDSKFRRLLSGAVKTSRVTDEKMAQ